MKTLDTENLGKERVMTKTKVWFFPLSRAIVFLGSHGFTFKENYRTFGVGKIELHAYKNCGGLEENVTLSRPGLSDYYPMILVNSQATTLVEELEKFGYVNHVSNRVNDAEVR